MNVRITYFPLGRPPVECEVIQPPPEPRGPTLVRIEVSLERWNPETGNIDTLRFPFFFQADFRDEGTGNAYRDWARQIMEEAELFAEM